MTGIRNKLLGVCVVAAAMTVSSVAFAQSGPVVKTMVPAAQVVDVGQAAVDAAVGQIMGEVAGLSLTPGLTVGGFLDATGGREELAGRIAAAPRPGGVRQLSAQTAQVRIEVTGEFLLAALVDIARARAERSPVPAELVASQGTALRGRQFVATGTVTTAAGAVSLTKASGDDKVDAADQIARARAEAVDLILARLQGAGVLPDDDAARQSARRYLQGCPVQRVVPGADGKLTVELAIVTDDLIAAMSGRVVEGAGSQELRDAVRQASLAADRTARVGVVRETGDGNPATVMLSAPAWVDDAFASSVRHKEKLSRLALVRAAERKAGEELRRQIVTRMNAAASGFGLNEALVERAADLAMGSAQTVSVEFVGPDEVVVVASVQGRKVWDAMQKIAVQGR